MGSGDGPPSRGPKLPPFFRSLVLLRRLNIAAMGLSLSAATATAFSMFMGSPNEYGLVAVATGMPTLVLGLLWAVLLRSKKTVAKTKLRWGWLLSVPLAALNGALACGLLFAGEGGSDPISKFFFGALAGATLGVFFWMPGLVATIAFFGLPVAWSQSLAEKGLAGEERGERVLGIASTLLATCALAAVAYWGRVADYPRNPAIDAVGNVFLWVVPFLGLVASVTAAVFAHGRELRRRRFVEQVGAGKVQGFRVEDVPEGKVLVRVSSLGEGGAYRVADFEEEVYALDAEGAAREEKRAMALPRR